jgi:hypothetical protein
VTRAPPDLPPDLPPPPPWLAPLQANLARLVQAPLDARTGTLRSLPGAYPPELVAQVAHPATARARLALYHEQYWMRLFTALQGELPRTSQAVGYWRFNALATAHLAARPPVDTDLARAADGFAPALLAALDTLVDRAGRAPAAPDIRPVAALLAAGAEPAALANFGAPAALANLGAPVDLVRQALRVDEAARHAFIAPLQATWRPSPAELAALPGRRLRFAASFRLLREDWALVERAAPPAANETPAPFPRHSPAAPRYWVSYRAERATAFRSVEPPFARFLTLAARRPFGDALAASESACDAPQRERLHAAVPGWIQLALASGWWVGLADAP